VITQVAVFEAVNSILAGHHSVSRSNYRASGASAEAAAIALHIGAHCAPPGEHGQP
jgi:hypothetical protein